MYSYTCYSQLIYMWYNNDNNSWDLYKSYFNWKGIFNQESMIICLWLVHDGWVLKHEHSLSILFYFKIILYHECYKYTFT